MQLTFHFHFQMATASAPRHRRPLPCCTWSLPRPGCYGCMAGWSARSAGAVIIYKTWGPASQTTIKVLHWRLCQLDCQLSATLRARNERKQSHKSDMRTLKWIETNMPKWVVEQRTSRALALTMVLHGFSKASATGCSTRHQTRCGGNKTKWEHQAKRRQTKGYANNGGEAGQEITQCQVIYVKSNGLDN